MAKKGKGGKGKSKGLFGAIGSALGSIPVVGKVKNAAKSAKKKIKKAKNKIKKTIKKAKKKLKKKIGKVFTKARKIKNNLSKSKIVKKFKQVAKKAVLVVKQVQKKAQTVVKQAKVVVQKAKETVKKTVIAAKNPLGKSLNSFKEIGKDFADGLNNRKNKALDSPYDFANYLTVGALDGIWSGAKSRADKMFNSPSDFLNYATFGLTDMVKGAVNPKDPLSKEHWLDSLGVATTVAGLKGVSSKKTTGGESGKSTNNSPNDTNTKGTGNDSKNNVQSTLGTETRFPTKQINPRVDQHIIDKVAEARGQLSNKYKEKGNFAYAEVNISGIDKKDFYAHSGIHDASKKIPGAEEFSFKTDNPIFQATEAPNKAGQSFLRDVDTEYKILNDLADKIGTNYEVKGSIRLFTEKDTCDSCNLIIKQFDEKYPNITIEVIHNNDNSILPK